MPLGTSKHAQTHIDTQEVMHDVTLLQIRLLTGHTHKIRATLSHLGHPIVGDVLYGSLCDETRMLLHCSAMTVELSDNQQITVRAPMPRDMHEYIDGCMG